MSTLTRYDRNALRHCQRLIGVDEVGRGAWAGPVVACAVAIDLAFLSGNWCRRRGREVNDSKRLSPGLRESLCQDLRRQCASGAIHFALGEAGVEEIERLNVFGATVLAMRRALEGLSITACLNLPANRDHRPRGRQSELDFSERTDDEAVASKHHPDALRGKAPEAVVDKLPHRERDGPLAGSAAAATTDEPLRILIDGKPLRALPYRHEAIVGGDSRSFCIALASILAKVSRDRAMAALDADYPQYGFGEHKGYGTPNHRAAILAHGPLELHRRVFLRNLDPDASGNQGPTVRYGMAGG